MYGIFTSHLPYKIQPNVGQHASPMDGMGINISGSPNSRHVDPWEFPKRIRQTIARFITFARPERGRQKPS